MKDKNIQSIRELASISKCTFEMAKYVLHDSVELERDFILAKELFNVGCPKEMIRGIILKLPNNSLKNR